MLLSWPLALSRQSRRRPSTPLKDNPELVEGAPELSEQPPLEIPERPEEVSAASEDEKKGKFPTAQAEQEPTLEPNIEEPEQTEKEKLARAP